MHFEDDTIIALATPAGVGAISVIRISGSESISTVDKIFKGKNKLTTSVSHTVHYGKIFSADNDLIDDVLVAIFRKPHSYTGEDSIEISTHGSPHIVQKIIQSLLKLNIRNAEPGEFTKRAFLNGKMDLAQAEAVADIINSRTEASLRGARNQLDGILSKKVDELRTKLLNASSLIELELDFAEDDLEFLSKQELVKLIDDIIDEIDKLLVTFRFGKVLRDGVNVAIVGKPNVGKSSLLNYILKESRVIVSEIPGTTRDVIREEIVIDGILFRLVDTAGIHTSKDEIEIEGILRSRRAVKESDVIIFLNDVNEGVSIEMYDYLCANIDKDRIITVMNKIDLLPSDLSTADVKISAITGQGIKSLFEILRERALGSKYYSEHSTIVSTIRHFIALEKCKEHLLISKESVEKKMSGEFISVDLRMAMNSLDEIIGKVTSQDVLNNIFMKFCIGK